MIGLFSDWDSYERAYMTWILILATSVTLGWDKSPEATVSKYRLYVGIQSMVAGNPPLVNYEIANSSAAPTYKVDGLDLGTQYFFVVTAVDGQGFESGYSNEVTYTPMPSPTPTPIQVFVSNPSFDEERRGNVQRTPNRIDGTLPPTPRASNKENCWRPA